MEIINIEICHTDLEYARALAQSLSEKGRKYSVTVTECDRIHKDVAADGMVIIYSSVKNDKKSIYINGYISVLELRTRISEELQLKENNDERKTQLVLVAGLEGGAGATSIAEGLAQEFTLYYGKKVCRISFDALCSMNKGLSQYSPNDQVHNLRRLLYFWEKGGVTREIIDEYFLPDENNVFHILYGKGVNPILLTEASKAVEFIDTICSKGDFDYLILDISILLYNLYHELWTYAEKVILVSKASKEKIMSFYKKDEKSNLIGVFNFANECKMYVKSEGEAGTSSIEFLSESIEISTIEEDKEIIEKDKIRIDGAFGTGIKLLAEKVEF